MATSSVIKPDTKKLEQKQIALRSMVDSIVVKDAETCLRAKTAQRDIRSEMKAIGFVLDPFVETAKQALQQARDERAKYLTPLESMDAVLAQKVKDYEHQEREAAQREQDRLNAERRAKAEAEAKEARRVAEEQAAADRKRREKEIAEAQKAGDLKKREAEALRMQNLAAEKEAKRLAAEEEARNRVVEDVQVKPNIPSVAGVPSRVNWRWKPVNPSEIPDQYWILYDQLIGQVVRRDKDKTNLPGIEVYPE